MLTEVNDEEAYLKKVAEELDLQIDFLQNFPCKLKENIELKSY